MNTAQLAFIETWKASHTGPPDETYFDAMRALETVPEEPAHLSDAPPIEDSAEPVRMPGAVRPAPVRPPVSE